MKKIAVVGCGAVGSYYGALLCRDGLDVHFLPRSDYDRVRRQGVRILSPAGEFTAHPRCALAPEEIGPSDVVLIGLKTTANDQFGKLLPPLVGPATAVVTLQNGLGNEEQLARIIPGEQVLGGLCFVCLNRLEPGLIEHTEYGTIVLGEFQGGPRPRTHAIAETLRHAGVPCKVVDDLAKAHWEKLVWNVPFNGLGVAGAAGRLVAGSGMLDREALPSALGPCLTTKQLLADPGWETLARELMLEVIAIARALGHQIPEELAEKQIARTRTMGAYKASTLLDFELGRPLELESLFLAPLEQARQAGIRAPRLTRLCEVLTALDAMSKTREMRVSIGATPG